MFDKTIPTLLKPRQPVFSLLCVFVFKRLIQNTLLLLLVTLEETQGNLLRINGLRIKSSEINKFDMSNNYVRLFSNSTEYRFPSSSKTKNERRKIQNLNR